ncbi:MAG: sodium-dependent transporter [Bernardetiaceae bacterium]
MSAPKEAWGSRLGLILAMAGNAVGLGNFLRFPVQAIQNGGGTFMIPYLVCFLLLGVPLLWVEWSMGRFGGKHGHHSTPFILDSMSKGRLWKYVGVFGIFTNVAVAAYYCYIESWTLTYAFHALRRTFAGMERSAVADFFADYTNTTTGFPTTALVIYLLCLALNTYILSRGLKGGVELVAKFVMPLLILFGAFLAIRGLTIGDSQAPAGCQDCDAFLALNFFWTPELDSLWNPKIWLAAAGQIFFTTSVGMGTIHCYAAYIRQTDDIALNAMSAGWMNGFVEVVLGGAVVIPIAAGYLGLDWVIENAGFSMAFQTMPFLFEQWGSLLAAAAGFAWFGLLFFAGITSSLAFGTPWMGFMRDEFGWSRMGGAVSFGVAILCLGLPTVIFYDQGLFDEYDYWSGTVGLVVFGLLESILFAWVFGIKRGWEEITRGADIGVPKFYRPVIQFVTPTLLLFVFLGAMFQPKNNDWQAALSGSWQLDAGSIIGKLQNVDLPFNRDWTATTWYSTFSGTIIDVDASDPQHQQITLRQRQAPFEQMQYVFDLEAGTLHANGRFLADVNALKSLPTHRVGQPITAGEPLVEGQFRNLIFYRSLGRLILLAMFLSIAGLVFLASLRR